MDADQVMEPQMPVQVDVHVPANERTRPSLPRDPRDSVAVTVVCVICGYSPGWRIPDRCPVCLTHRDHFKTIV